MALNVKQLFELGVKVGISNDPRGKDEAMRTVNEAKKAFEKMEEDEKKFFNKERLTNPYLDSAISYDNGNEIKKAYMGIDCESSELLLAKQMGVDTVIAHHPEGRGLLDLEKVMYMQTDTLHAAGVPVNQSDKSMSVRCDDVRKSVHAANVYQNVDIAKQLDINYLNLHTPADNCVDKFLKDHLDKKDLRTLDDIVKAIREIPEFEQGAIRGDGPEIYVGSGKSRAGKIYCSMSGGTSPGDDIYEKMAQSGIGTIVEMHFTKAAMDKCKKYGINLISSGHIPSDSLGLNILADEIEGYGVEIIPVSGMIRVKRK